MSRALVFIGRRTAFECQQRRIEPFSFGDETLMLLLERLQTRSRPFQFCLCPHPGIFPRNIAPGAFEFDFSAAARTLVFQLHLIVPNHAFDQLVPREHPFPSALKFGSFLGSNLWYPRPLAFTMMTFVRYPGQRSRSFSWIVTGSARRAHGCVHDAGRAEPRWLGLVCILWYGD